MYRIGEFSKLSKTTIKTLRYYAEAGILEPEYIDEFTGYRFYSTKQLVELHKIQAYRQIGLSINEIKLILKYGDDENILLKRKTELEMEIANSIDQLSRIEFIISNKQEGLFMNYEARIKELPHCIVYSKKL
ncbi:MerR family transcriptional regulator [Romboutsia sp.]|uniref:MerR family transcriptional regulator n=1 Tax=Romboutsia sp. TaxID=1965302 RepID=UPI003F367134